MAFGIAGAAVFSFLLFQTQAITPATDNKSASVTDAPDTPPPLTCPAGTPIGPVDLEVRSLKSPDSLPFQTIIHLSEGDTVIYKPLLKSKEKRIGEVALVMVPAKRSPQDPPLLVTDPKPAAKQQEWTIPQTIALAAFVYGPGGLSKRKVEGFLSQDDQLVAQLADYAEKTSQTEALLSALSENTSSAGMNAALSGFASQYGLSTQIDRTAPPAVQAQTLFSTMNPQLATYNPLASNTGERVGQTASLATAAATLFFGSPIAWPRVAPPCCSTCVTSPFQAPSSVRHSLSPCPLRNRALGHRCQPVRTARPVAAAHARRLHLGQPHPERAHAFHHHQGEQLHSGNAQNTRARRSRRSGLEIFAARPRLVAGQ